MALGRGLATLALLTPLIATGCVAPRVDAHAAPLTFACRDHEVLHYRSLIEIFQAEHPSVVIRLASLDEITSHFPEHAAGDIGRIAQAVDAFVASAPDEGLALEGVLLDLAPYAQAGGLYPGDALFAGTVKSFARGDALYGLPHQAHAFVLYYDPAAFEEAGLSPPRLGWTRDDLLRAAVATTVRQGGVTERYGLVDRWPGYTVAALSGGDGAGTGTLVAMALADSLLWYADLVRVYGAAPDVSDPDVAEHVEALLMAERPPAMWTGHSFEAGRFRRRYGAELVPLPQAPHPAAPITVEGYMISAKTAHPEAAWQWIEFLSRQPSAAYYGGIMARRSGAYWEDLDESTAMVFRYCLEHGRPYDPQVWTPVQTALLGVLRGEALSEVLRGGPWESAGGRRDTSTRPATRGDRPVFAARAVEAPHMLPETGGVEPVTIRFGVRSGQDLDVYGHLADRFSLERSDIVVEVVGAHAEADCYIAGAEVARRSTEELVPVDGIATAWRLSRAHPRALLDPLRSQGHVWGLPLDADARMLVYNRARFDAAGMAYPTAGWSAQCLVEHALLLTDTTVDPPTYGYWPRGGATSCVGQMIAWLGGSLLAADGLPTLDSPTAVAAMQRYMDLIAAAPPEADAGATDDVALPWGHYPAPVAGGQVAMWLDDYASARHASEGNPSLGFAPLPLGAVMPRPKLERALYIHAGTAHPEACWEWLWFLGGRPEAVNLLPARSDLAANPGWRQRVGDDVAHAWVTTLERWYEAGDAWGPYSDGMTLRWVDRAFAEVLQGADPQDALGRAQAQAHVYAECMASAQGPVASWEECLRVAEEQAIEAIE